MHETILEVNLGAMVANLNHYRAMLRPETKGLQGKKLLLMEPALMK